MYLRAWCLWSSETFSSDSTARASGTVRLGDAHETGERGRTRHLSRQVVLEGAGLGCVDEVSELGVQSAQSRSHCRTGVVKVVAAGARRRSCSQHLYICARVRVSQAD